MFSNNKFKNIFLSEKDILNKIIQKQSALVDKMKKEKRISFYTDPPDIYLAISTKVEQQIHVENIIQNMNYNDKDIQLIISKSLNNIYHQIHKNDEEADEFISSEEMKHELKGHIRERSLELAAEERQQQFHVASSAQTTIRIQDHLANLDEKEKHLLGQLEKQLNERQEHILESGRKLISDLIIKAVPIESSKSTYVEWQLLSTHRPTSASYKTNERPGEVYDFNNKNNSQTRASNDQQYQQNDCSSSSLNSSLISSQHKSNRTCSETKEISCTTDDGFWIEKQYYHALDDTSKELFDSLIDKLEKIRIANDENAVRKQQSLVGENRSNKTQVFPSSILSTIQSNDEKDLTIKLTEDEQDNKVEQSTNGDEQKETKDLTSIEQESTTAVTVDQK